MCRIQYCFIILISLICMVPSGVLAQSSFIERVGRSNMPERGIVIVGGVGVAAVKSDICGLPQCNNFGPAVNVGALYKVSPYLAYAANLSYMQIGATEKDPDRPKNVTFQTDMIEFSGSVVLNLMDSYAGSGNYRSARKRFAVPYIRGGVGMGYYTATSYPGEGELNDSQTTYDPVRKYPAITAVVPLAAGMRFRFSDEFSVAPELAYQLTLSDYLDNLEVDTNGGTDHYMVAYFKIMYTPVLKNKILTRKY